MSEQENKLEELLAADDLNAVRKSKNYAAPALLQLKGSCENEHDFYPLVADAVRDGTLSDLTKFLPYELNPNWICEACGYEGVEFDLIPEEFRYTVVYMKRVVEKDNLELFLKYRILLNPIYYLHWLGKYCSQRIMTYYGFTELYVRYYVEDALHSYNKGTLLFLLDGDFTSADQVGDTFLSFMGAWNVQFDHLFIVDCFRNKLITLDEKGWQTLKRLDASLYDKVQDDV